MQRCCCLVLCLGISCVAQAQTPETLVKDAIAKQQAGDLETAVKEYNEFLKLQPNAAAVRCNLGAALVGLGRFEEAIKEYKIALKEAPSLPGAALNLSLAYYKMGRIAEAAGELEKVPAQATEHSQATLLLADCYLRMGQNKDVIRILEPVEASRPDDLAIAYLLGTALIRDNQVAKGQVLVDRILRNGNSPEAHLMLGSAKMSARDFAGARDEFAKAEALNSNLPDVHGLYAQALEATGDPDGAVREFKAELAVDPYNYEANFQIGALLHENGQDDEALQHFARALNVRTGDLATRYQLAIIDIGKGNLQHAEQELEAIVKQVPDFTAAHVSLATVYFRLKKVDEGKRERATVQRLTAEAQAKQPGVQAR
jgi:tetratricopeptide (TPR) repeat protein